MTQTNQVEQLGIWKLPPRFTAGPPGHLTLQQAQRLKPGDRVYMYDTHAPESESMLECCFQSFDRPHDEGYSVVRLTRIGQPSSVYFLAYGVRLYPVDVPIYDE